MAIRNNLDDIVNVDIEISTPASSDESFSNILMVVEAPDGEAETEIGESVIAISKASDLDDYGFTSTHQAYIMATLAFSQTPEPDTNEIPGYSITVPASSSFSDTEKASRKLTGCTFTAKLAGAIQVVEISGNLVYA